MCMTVYVCVCLCLCVSVCLYVCLCVFVVVLLTLEVLYPLTSNTRILKEVVNKGMLLCSSSECCQSEMKKT